MIPVVWQTFIRFPGRSTKFRAILQGRKIAPWGWKAGGSTESVALESTEFLYTNGIVEGDIRIYIR